MQHGGIVTRSTFAMLGEHGPEAVIPLKRVGQPSLDIDYDHMRSVFAEALAENTASSPQNVHVQVVTERGEVIVEKVIRRLADESTNGKIVIHARGIGNLRRF